MMEEVCKVKPIFRRASTTIIIFSFIFPWIKLKIPFASDIYGFTLIKYLLKIGFHIRRGELTFLALIALMILLFALFTLLLPSLIPRSEERRVGKECRSEMSV